VVGHRIYFEVRPFIPQPVRTAFRRRIALQLRDRVEDVWPLLKGAEVTPKDWPGWPEKKQFALVLTHDVEGPKGLRNVRPLAELEMELGLRSSFNFIPEGSYHAPESLRAWLVENGFEVGIHDLRHDGKLYLSRWRFNRRARRINKYLRDWNASGFRSGFMLCNLEWLHQLDIEYDASTFDTDPFEPQPEGYRTIYPIWVPQPATSHLYRDTFSKNGGFVELPYTLPQDFTLFLLLQEKSIAVWKTKFDWIASYGGMVLMNTHPDYMSFGRNGSNMAFPASHYRELLQYGTSRYSGRYWAALPREVASWGIQHRNGLASPQHPKLITTL
jgi:hypothetical protein